MSTILQPQFDLRIPAGRPLVPMEAAMLLLDRDPDDILNLITLGELRWAWDIKSADARRREVRIHRDCILAYPGKFTPSPGGEGRDEGEQLISTILPRHSTVIDGQSAVRAAEIARRFNCENSHVLNLIAEGSLKIAPSVRLAKQSPLILASSLAQFLRERRMS